METKWSISAWKAAEPVYEAILKLPFITELKEGTLAAERFNFYIGQDSLYINVYSRVLAHIASRLADMTQVEDFLKFAGDGVYMEKALHSLYVSDGPRVMSPACLLYTSLLKAQAYDDVAVEAASILPCFWIYWAVGCHIFRTARIEGNPYADWIKAYSNEEFDKSNARAIAICDDLAARASDEVRARMTEIFVQAARMEWLFWHSAYNMEQWPDEIRH